MEKLLANKGKKFIKRKYPKVIAFYLPQFHRVAENDMWWGEGFTDWIAAKKAKPLFLGHYQPRIPEHNNFYDLLDKRTMEWQTKLATKAGVYGFCIYHYWFGNDRKLLEKPAENLLEWGDIKMPFCFCWANGSWIASWSKIREDGAGAWTDYNNKKNDNSDGMLMKQEYGQCDEWIRHFKYLLPFFKDERYIKKDNKPIFMVYMPHLISCMSKMAKVWNELAKENGFSGIHFIGANIEKKDCRYKGFDAIVRFEPNYTLAHEERKEYVIRTKVREKVHLKVPYFINYDKFWKFILNRKLERSVYPGAIIDYDCSPRRGKNAMIMRNATPYKFYKYFKELVEACRKQGTEYIFLFAWNEWGEGAYLEPDKKYGNKRLAYIKKVLDDLGGA